MMELYDEYFGQEVCAAEEVDVDDQQEGILFGEPVEDADPGVEIEAKGKAAVQSKSKYLFRIVLMSFRIDLIKETSFKRIELRIVDLFDLDSIKAFKERSC